jgi:hypothetical protein
MRRPPFRRSTGSLLCCRFRPGRAERHGFEYYRHGTLSLYAALDTATGRVHGKIAARHTSRDFVDFLKEVVSRCPPEQQIHIIDNLSAHKTAWCKSSWSRILACGSTSRPPTLRGSTRVIARGVFTSVPDLARKLRRYINAYSANAQPIQWKYSDPSRRIRSNGLSATGH